ncbi:MAG: sensor histidine kinase [Candidatus Cryptobacteroides sp.]
MNKEELFNFINDNHILEESGNIFLVVDESLQIHNIAYDPVDTSVKLCIGDYLKCTNAVSSSEGCGCHQNCKRCNLRGMVEESMHEMKKMEADASLLLQNNQDYCAHVISTPFIDNGKKFSIVLLLDRTSRQRELMLERIFCHDLLNLSGALNGLLDTMEHSDSDEMRSVLKSISSQMMEEIKAQRDLIYAINGLLKPSKEFFKASEVLDFVKGSLCQIARDMYNVNIIIDSDLAEEQLESDKVLINRVIHNMVKNACEDNAAGDVIVRAKVEEYAIVFSVHNDAVMSLDTKSKVFIQGNTTKKQGHGLGTYSMKLIGENYLGGKIYFESEENFGTEFYFELPKANL